MKNLIALGCFMSLLAACAATPVAIHYYLFSPAPAPGSALIVPVPGRITIVIARVELSSYLRRGGLVMQSGSNELVVSSSHLWAEPLDAAVPKALQSELQHRSDDFAFYLQDHDWIDEVDYRLRLRLDNLFATDAGQVVASGRFQLIDAAGVDTVLTRDFSLQRELLDDGYGEAVRQMRALIGQIAETVLEDMAAYSNAREKP